MFYPTKKLLCKQIYFNLKLYLPLAKRYCLQRILLAYDCKAKHLLKFVRALCFLVCFASLLFTLTTPELDFNGYYLPYCCCLINCTTQNSLVNQMDVWLAMSLIHLCPYHFVYDQELHLCLHLSSFHQDFNQSH